MKQKSMLFSTTRLSVHIKYELDEMLVMSSCRKHTAGSWDQYLWTWKPAETKSKPTGECPSGIFWVYVTWKQVGDCFLWVHKPSCCSLIIHSVKWSMAPFIRLENWLCYNIPKMDSKLDAVSPICNSVAWTEQPSWKNPNRTLSAFKTNSCTNLNHFS